MEENIRNIKRNVKEIRKEVKSISNKSKNGDSIDSEIFLINERLWNIAMYIKDLETFI